MKRKKQNRILLLLLLAVVPTVFLLPRLFPISRIECFTRGGSCPSEYLQSLEPVKGRLLLWQLPQTDARAALGKFSDISGFSLHRRLPHTLIVNINRRTAVGVVAEKVLGKSIAVDQNGFAFSRQPPEGLPTLYLDNIPDPPAELDAPVSASVSILSGLQRVLGTVVSGILEAGVLSVNLPSGTQLIFDPENIPQQWDRSLQAILSGSKMTAKLPLIIDLRYTDPVVTF